MAKKKQRPDPVSYLDDTPVPMTDFWMRAIDFHDAYKNLRRQKLFSWARYALIGHATEVALKSYLMARGWKRKKLLKTFSHDLDALLAEAKDNGLNVDGKVEKDIGHLNHVHNNFLARYPEYEGLTTNDGKGIVVVEELAPSVEKLLSAIGTGLAPPQKRSRNHGAARSECELHRLAFGGHGNRLAQGDHGANENNGTSFARVRRREGLLPVR